MDISITAHIFSLFHFSKSRFESAKYGFSVSEKYEYSCLCFAKFVLDDN